jgi:hydrogenase expression/formation protein HypE
VEAILNACPDTHVLRDPTRGGVASALNEIAGAAGVGMMIREDALPLRGEIKAACDIFGLDPLYVANEGKLIAIVPAGEAEATLAAMRRHPDGSGRGAVIIGEVVADHPGTVMMRSRIGGNRVVDMLSGEQLPRIC